jgi:hypothetical protein
MHVTSQSKPSKRPLPFVADVSWMDHCRLLMVPRPSASEIWKRARMQSVDAAQQ